MNEKGIERMTAAEMEAELIRMRSAVAKIERSVQVKRIRDAHGLLCSVEGLDIPHGEYFQVIRLLRGWLDKLEKETE